VSLKGAAPPNRVVLLQFESMDKRKVGTTPISVPAKTRKAARLLPASASRRSKALNSLGLIESEHVYLIPSGDVLAPLINWPADDLCLNAPLED
jgi:hypothetical protein